MNRNLKWKALLIAAIAVWSVWSMLPLNKKINLGLDLQGGMHLVLKVDTEKLPEKARVDAVERALEIIRNRIDQFGVKEPSIQRQGKDAIVVQLPGVTNRDRAIELIGKTALLEFKLVSDDAAKLLAAKEGNVPEGYELTKDDETDEGLLLEKEAVLTGDALTTASVRFDESRFNEPIVGLEFNAKGAKRFAQITGDNVGRRLAIVLDGKLHSAPRINEPIPSGQAVITGKFSQDQAADLAIVLRAGALPAPIIMEEERTVGSLLGQDSIHAGIKATIIGGILVVAFMSLYYLLAGAIASFAVLLNFLIIMGALASFHFTLTLPGIAGMILTVGMAVDANVLINERIREELKTGKTLRSAVAAGYHKAFTAIFDSNFTTIIAAILLFQFGTGPIRGFGVTLTIGLIASMFTAIVVTRFILDLLMLSKKFTTLKMLKLIGETKMDFIAKRKICYVMSILLIAGGAVVFFSKGDRAYGIDFTGGQIQQYQFTSPPKLDDVRFALKEAGLKDASIQQFGEAKGLLIKTAGDTAKLVQDTLRQKFPDNSFETLRIERVGPSVGKDLRKRASLALLYALIGILIYVGIRFKNFAFGFAGVLALFHDVFVTVAVLAVTNREITLTIVAALLTIAGYSINDTIVIFDRVREDLRTTKKLTLYDAINMAVNQTLSRTILTSGVTLLVVIALFFFGGDVLNDFAFSLLVGFISGVYSTVFIASPLVLAWRKKH